MLKSNNDQPMKEIQTTSLLSPRSRRDADRRTQVLRELDDILGSFSETPTSPKQQKESPLPTAAPTKKEEFVRPVLTKSNSSKDFDEIFSVLEDNIEEHTAMLKHHDDVIQEGKKMARELKRNDSVERIERRKKEEEDKRKAEEEMKRKREEEEEQRKRREEEKKMSEEKRRREEEERKRRADEEERRRQEAEKQRRLEEEKRRKDEEAARRQREEEAARAAKQRQQQEEEEEEQLQSRSKKTEVSKKVPDTGPTSPKIDMSEVDEIVAMLNPVPTSQKRAFTSRAATVR
jgi:hypothetical protein